MTIISKLAMPGPHRTEVKTSLAVLHGDALRHSATNDDLTNQPTSHQHISACLVEAAVIPVKPRARLPIVLLPFPSSGRLPCKQGQILSRAWRFVFHDPNLRRVYPTQKYC